VTFPVDSWVQAGKHSPLLLNSEMRLRLDFPIIGDNYRTATQSISWFSKSFPSIGFYRKMILIVNHAARLAKRGIYNDEQWCGSSYRILKAIENVGTSMEVKNLDKLTRLSDPCIIVGNHMSTLETFLLPYLICPYKKVTFVVKEALTTYPIFKHVMISRNPVVVGRDNPKQDFLTVMNEGIKRINEGYSVVVFPQTTRMVEFDREQFNSIGVKLARKAGVPIVPLALKTDCWGNGSLIKDFGKIDPHKSINFEFGDPLEVQGTGKFQQEFIIEHIQNCLTRWNEKN
jgi:1-acyl-sn-glycerol-3-phosphate acyltransferase